MPPESDPNRFRWKDIVVAAVGLAGAMVGAALGAVVGAVFGGSAARNVVAPPLEAPGIQPATPRPQPARPPLPPGWHYPRPERIPEPTYTPMLFALGIILIALGITTSYLVALVGLFLFIVGLGRWIGELSHEH